MTDASHCFSKQPSPSDKYLEPGIDAYYHFKTIKYDIRLFVLTFCVTISCCHAHTSVGAPLGSNCTRDSLFDRRRRPPISSITCSRTTYRTRALHNTDRPSQTQCENVHQGTQLRSTETQPLRMMHAYGTRRDYPLSSPLYTERKHEHDRTCRARTKKIYLDFRFIHFDEDFELRTPRC